MIEPLSLVLNPIFPQQALRALSGLEGVCFFHSSSPAEANSRYSFLMADPFETLRYPLESQENVAQDPWQILKASLKKYTLAPNKEAPPFRGGAAGFFSYELANSLESLPAPVDDGFFWPEMMLGLYDVVTVFDHATGEVTLYSSGFPEIEEDTRGKRARERADWFRQLFESTSQKEADVPVIPRESWSSNFDPSAYRSAVEKVRNYIAAGDIFQANISQRFSSKIPPKADTITIYGRLCSLNPAPFSAFIQFGEHTVISASPERFISLKGLFAETRPIKGTCPRSQDPSQDQQLAIDLQNSIKDRAENTMIVDLLRHDFSKVCVAGTVEVPQLCGLESFANVHHLVSVIQGELKADKGSVDLLQACFPGGSISGAPKKRSMEIIQEVEGLPRHVYCGAMGYLGFDGNMDTNIAIRTLLVHGNNITFQSGGGITWLSNPEEEYQETLLKASKLFSVFEA